MHLAALAHFVLHFGTPDEFDGQFVAWAKNVLDTLSADS